MITDHKQTKGAEIMTFIAEYFEESELDGGGRYRAIYVEADDEESARLALIKATDGKVSKVLRFTAHKKAS